MDIQWWHWLVAGLALLVIELAVPGMVVLWFGVAAIGIGLLLWAVPTLSLTLQLALWAVLSCVLVFAWFRVFRADHRQPSTRHQPQTRRIFMRLNIGRGDRIIDPKTQ